MAAMSQDMVDDILEIYSEGASPIPLNPGEWAKVVNLTLNYLHGVSAAATTIAETYEIASFVSASLCRRARETNIPIKSIAERIHVPYKITADMYRRRAAKDAGHPLRSNKEVRLDWDTKMAEGNFLDSERIVLAFLMSMACYVRLAASFSNSRQEAHFRSHG